MRIDISASIQGPCKDCPDRHVLCHSNCEKYADYKARVEELSTTIREDEKKRSEVVRYQTEQKRKSKKKHGEKAKNWWRGM